MQFRWLIELIPQHHQNMMTIYYAGYFDHTPRNLCPATTYHALSAPTWFSEVDAAAIAKKLQPIPGYEWVAREHVFCDVEPKASVSHAFDTTPGEPK